MLCTGADSAACTRALFTGKKKSTIHLAQTIQTATTKTNQKLKTNNYLTHACQSDHQVHSFYGYRTFLVNDTTHFAWAVLNITLLVEIQAYHQHFNLKKKKKKEEKKKNHFILWPLTSSSTHHSHKHSHTDTCVRQTTPQNIDPLHHSMDQEAPTVPITFTAVGV